MLGVCGGARLPPLQVRGGQKAVQQEVEKLQLQNGAAAAVALPVMEQGRGESHIGRNLPPTKVCYTLARQLIQKKEQGMAPLLQPAGSVW